MALNVSDMPVYLVDYDETWPMLFSAERERLVENLSGFDVEIEHIGSTAIPCMAAKPIIDIMVLIGGIDEAEHYILRLKALEYHYYPYGEDTFPERRWFCKPNPTRRTHHLHLVERDSPFHRDHLLFRDYLRVNGDAAEQYEFLKRRLAQQYSNDRDGYTNGKTEYVADILSRARLVAGTQ